MSNDVAVRQVNVLTTEQLQYLAHTEFVQPGLRGNMPAILACVATGRALGIDDMTALRSIYIIDGRPSFSAELMVQRVRAAGHSVTGEVDEGRATVTGRRADNGDQMTATWTLAMAERAGLAGKQNWKRYPESMLWARAVSQLCRMLFADCFAGATYTTEELGADDTDPYGVPGDEDDRLFPPADQPVPGMAALGEGAAVGEVAESGSAPILGEPERAAPAPSVEYCSPAQAQKIVIAAQKAGLSDDERHELVEALTGQPSSKRVPRAQVSEVLAEIAARAEARNA